MIQPVLQYIILSFVWITYNKETGTKQDGLHSYVHIYGEIDTEGVGIRQRFTERTCPLFRYVAHLGPSVFGKYLQSTIHLKQPIFNFNWKTEVTSKLITEPQQLNGKRGPLTLRTQFPAASFTSKSG